MANIEFENMMNFTTLTQYWGFLWNPHWVNRELFEEWISYLNNLTLECALPMRNIWMKQMSHKRTIDEKKEEYTWARGRLLGASCHATILSYYYVVLEALRWEFLCFCYLFWARPTIKSDRHGNELTSTKTVTSCKKGIYASNLCKMALE